MSKKTTNMAAFERELKANVRTLRPELTVVALLRDQDPAFAVVQMHDFKRGNVDVRLVAPTGHKSGPYTYLVLEHFDALVALR